MRPGTPGFIGDRLREAREARGVTGIALAEMLGVTRQAVSQYETGLATPAPDVLQRIASVLNVPDRFFSRPIERTPIDTVFYRSFASATKAARVRAERRYGWLREIIYHLEQFIELPEPELPDASPNPLTLSNNDIESIAQQVRAEFGLDAGPVPNLVALLENKGAIVSRLNLGAETLDAFSEWAQKEHRPYFVLSAEKDSAARSRLDAAHELGHMVLHRHLPRTLLTNKEVFDLVESQAFRFAGAFLLPQQEFSDDFFFPTLAELRRLKGKWGVSMSATLKRCQELDLLPENEITRLWVALSRSGWRKREPLDGEIEPEQPCVVRESFELIIEEGVRTKRQLREALPFNPRDIEVLAGLPPNFLDEDPAPAPVIELRTRPTSSGERPHPDDTGRVVPFFKKDK